ncbi:hypothetical protein F66182_172 [Fusarium sp. NRRL 66182]|nr:hypothetical protein F66182_172 [Fusarium sp. NRRL 66182]
MAHKRKRSVSEFCGSPSSVSSFDSPPRVGNSLPNPFAFVAATPIHLNSRTMKRFRDNRPSEEMIHQRTLNMLYSAQNQHQPILPSEIAHTSSEAARPDSHQQSLHRFWNISSAPSTSSSDFNQTEATPSNCDDCGAGLSDPGEEGMEIDGFENECHSCGACGKHVCFSCSVSNLGEQRRCLQCAGRKG